METRAAQPPSAEKQRSFDPLASINMFRYDLRDVGYVRPETREQVCNEELSYLAEGVNRAIRIPFALKREGDELVYFKDGEWRPYTAMLLTGLRTEQGEADIDPRRQFLVDWALNDQEKGYAMRGLKPGEQIAWYNPYPHDKEAMYGKEFMNSCGLQADREMGFIYRAHCNDEGDVVLQTQSVDKSDPDAFAAVEEAIKYDPDISMDALVKTYDGALFKKTGERTHAGRSLAEAQQDTWEAILAQKPLIEYMLDGIEAIAELEPSDADEMKAKRHIYGVWALFKKRLDGEEVTVQQTIIQAGGVLPPPQVMIALEVQSAYNDFVKKGKVLIGCGGSISMVSGEDAIMSASAKDIFDSIFGEESSDGTAEDYDFDTWMFCTDCQKPPDEGDSKKWCGPCGLCRGCDKKAGGKG